MTKGDPDAGAADEYGDDDAADGPDEDDRCAPVMAIAHTCCALVALVALVASLRWLCLLHRCAGCACRIVALVARIIALVAR